MARANKSVSGSGLYFHEEIEKHRDSVIIAELNKLISEVAEIKTALASHTHGGVTAGSANTSAHTITFTETEADYVG